MFSYKFLEKPWHKVLCLLTARSSSLGSSSVSDHVCDAKIRIPSHSTCLLCPFITSVPFFTYEMKRFDLNQWLSMGQQHPLGICYGLLLLVFFPFSTIIPCIVLLNYLPLISLSYSVREYWFILTRGQKNSVIRNFISGLLRRALEVFIIKGGLWVT